MSLKHDDLCCVHSLAQGDDCLQVHLEGLIGLLRQQYDNQIIGPNLSSHFVSSHDCVNCHNWRGPSLPCCLQAELVAAQLLWRLPVHVGYMSTEEWVLPLSW